MASRVAVLNNGVEMPLVGLGTWKSKDGVVGDAVKAAVRAGYRHIDCAHCYDNEHEVGKALYELIEAGEVTRDELFIVSKLWNTKHEERDVERALRHTLAQLRLERLDLYLVHWPFAWRRTEGVAENFPRRADGSGPEYDYEQPREDGSEGLVDPSETWRGMEAVYRAGLTRAIGVSNFNEAQLAALAASARVPCAVNQVESHPLLPQRSLLAFCEQHGIVLTAYSPLGSPDNVRARKHSDPSLLGSERIAAIGASHGKSAAQVLVRFHTQRGVATIPKSKTASYIAANLDTFDFELSEAQLSELCAMGDAAPFRYGDNAGAKSHPNFPWPEWFSEPEAPPAKVTRTK
jgi:diketogulonate reductase-like aldo/keto reductase